MATQFATEAAYVKELGHLETGDISRATGADPTTVRAWLRGTRSPSGRFAERLAELSSIVERLVLVIEPTYVRVWLLKPNVSLEHDKPIDVLALGDHARVSRSVAALESTAMS